MASDTLDLLDEIVKEADAAAGKGPGQPLRADDWNALADAVVRLARLAAARERNEGDTLAKNFASADHQHLGAVGLAWLDAETRALVEARGGAGDVAARVDGLARETKALRSDLAALTAEVGKLRDDLANAGTDNRVRDADLLKLGRRLDGIIDLDRKVTALDGRIATVDGAMRAALAFGDTLKDASGNPLDLARLETRVAGLETTEARLRLADGEVVRMRDFENRIADLEASAVTDATLDGRLAARLDALAAAPDSVLVTRSAAAAEASLAPRLARLDAGLEEARGGIAALGTARDETTARLATLDAGLAGQATRSDALAADVARLAPLAERMTAVEAVAAGAARAAAGIDAVRGQVTILGVQVNAALTQARRVSPLEATVAGLDGRVVAAEQAVAGLPDLRGRIAAAEAAATRADALAGRVDAAEAQASGFADRLTVAEAQLGAVDRLSARLGTTEARLDDVASWRTTVDRRLADLPGLAAVTDLTRRMTLVEQRAADQQLAIDRLRITDRPVVTPIRPTG